MTLSTQTRGIQLTLTQKQQKRRRAPAPPHPPCPICAGPTARHGARNICAVCGHGAQEQPRRRPAYRPRRHPN